jgi:hypothetical protein
MLRFRIKNVVQSNYLCYCWSVCLKFEESNAVAMRIMYASLWSLRNLGSWFESPSGHECICVSFCCHVQVKALKWPIPHPKSLTEYLNRKRKGADGARKDGQKGVSRRKTEGHTKSWPRGLRHEMSSSTQTLGPWVQIPLKAWMSMCVYSVFVLSCVGSGLPTAWSTVRGVYNFKINSEREQTGEPNRRGGRRQKRNKEIWINETDTQRARDNRKDTGICDRPKYAKSGDMTLPVRLLRVENKKGGRLMHKSELNYNTPRPSVIVSCSILPLR